MRPASTPISFGHTRRNPTQAVPPPVSSGADSVHLAAALRLGVGTIVTPDAQLARAAVSLGVEVLGPVAEAPGRASVV